ncbi:SMI1/KNR4 family protein [Kutzneria kofuensis]|uniref:SMI1/KNR4 family protein n=1 Tax=Kutzneria kofuensis TaxID=103725 RepID=UPI003CD0A8A1
MADFDEIKVAFWGDGTYDVQPPLTDEDVREAEALLGVTLPAALLDLLRIQNGGGVACGPAAVPDLRADFLGRRPCAAARPDGHRPHQGRDFAARRPRPDRGVGPSRRRRAVVRRRSHVDRPGLPPPR